MQCFFCGGHAEDISPGDFDGVVLACPKCNPYEVARSVLGKLAALDPDARSRLLEGPEIRESGNATGHNQQLRVV